MKKEHEQEKIKSIHGFVILCTLQRSLFWLADQLYKQIIMQELVFHYLSLSILQAHYITQWSQNRDLCSAHRITNPCIDLIFSCSCSFFINELYDVWLIHDAQAHPCLVSILFSSLSYSIPIPPFYNWKFLLSSSLFSFLCPHCGHS